MLPNKFYTNGAKLTKYEDVKSAWLHDKTKLPKKFEDFEDVISHELSY